MIYVRFFFKAPATTEIYTYGHTLSQHDALPLWPRLRGWIEESRDDLRMRQRIARAAAEWQASERDTDLLYRGTPLLTAQEWLARNPDLVGDRSEEHTSELQSLMRISYAVFCLNKKTKCANTQNNVPLKIH